MKRKYKKPKAEILNLQTMFGYMEDVGFNPVEGSPIGGEGLHAKPFLSGSFDTDWENGENEEDNDNTNETN